MSEVLSEGVRRDLAASSAYYQAHHTSFGEFSTKVNDTYLKVNSQPQGVATYGRMVDLLLAERLGRRGALLPARFGGPNPNYKSCLGHYETFLQAIKRRYNSPQNSKEGRKKAGEQ